MAARHSDHRRWRKLDVDWLGSRRGTDGPGAGALHLCRPSQVELGDCSWLCAEHSRASRPELLDELTVTVRLSRSRGPLRLTFAEFAVIDRFKELAQVKNSIKSAIPLKLFNCFAVILQASVPQIGSGPGVITTAAKRPT